MKYKNILLAIDLAATNDPIDIIISKAVSLAKNLDATLSFVHVDISHLDNDTLVYDKAEIRLMTEKHQALLIELQALCESIAYPISNTLVLGGEVEVKLVEAVKNMDIDLLISGHHHGYWSRWWSSAHKLLDLTVVDLLLIRI